MGRCRSAINIDANQPMSGMRGFTLIETLVALAIIAIALLGILAVAAKSTHVSSMLQQRNFANWIAQNEIARLRLASQWPDIGDSNDNVDFANQKWHWEAEVAKTQDDALRRVTVTVSLADDPDSSITRLVGFLGKPPPQPVALPQPDNKQQASQDGQ